MVLTTIVLTRIGTDKALLGITDRVLTEMKAPKVVLTGRVPYKK